MSKLPRVASIILPILRDAFPSAQVTTWIPDVDYRVFPMIQVRRIGGTRHETRPTLLGTPVIELTVYTIEGLPETEQLYEDVLEVLYDAVAKQKQTDAGYLHSIKETLGATQFSSLFQDSWRVQGLIQLGIRPPRSA
jgi:hypothetical protein